MKGWMRKGFLAAVWGCCTVGAVTGQELLARLPRTWALVPMAAVDDPPPLPAFPPLPTPNAPAPVLPVLPVTEQAEKAPETGTGPRTKSAVKRAAPLVEVPPVPQLTPLPNAPAIEVIEAPPTVPVPQPPAITVSVPIEPLPVQQVAQPAAIMQTSAQPVILTPMQAPSAPVVQAVEVIEVSAPPTVTVIQNPYINETVVSGPLQTMPEAAPQQRPAEKPATKGLLANSRWLPSIFSGNKQESAETKTPPARQPDIKPVAQSELQEEAESVPLFNRLFEKRRPSAKTTPRKTPAAPALGEAAELILTGSEDLETGPLPTALPSAGTVQSCPTGTCATGNGPIPSTPCETGNCNIPVSGQIIGAPTGPGTSIRLPQAAPFGPTGVIHGPGGPIGHAVPFAPEGTMGELVDEDPIEKGPIIPRYSKLKRPLGGKFAKNKRGNGTAVDDSYPEIPGGAYPSMGYVKSGADLAAPPAVSPSGFLSWTDGRLHRPGWWAWGEFMGLEMTHMKAPPLVTASSPTSPNPAALGAPGTTVLFDTNNFEKPINFAGRFGMGIWFPHTPEWGLDASYFYLVRREGKQTFGSNGDPALGHPYIELAPGNEGETAFLFANGNLLVGSSTVNYFTELWTADGNLRHRWFSGKRLWIDSLFGYRYLQMQDHLGITDNLTLGPATLRAGDRFVLSDSFVTRNEFHGGQIGIEGGLKLFRCFFIEASAKVAVGNMLEVVEVQGATSYFPTNGGSASFLGSGFYAQPSNVGQQSISRIAAIPEGSAKVGYELTSFCKVYLGANILYITSIVRAGEQVDRTINTTQSPTFIPNGAGPGAVVIPGALFGQSRPTPPLKDTDFLRTGASIGIEFHF